MTFGYPVMLELSGRRCVVIGAQAIREGKVEGLLAAGADDVLVVEPSVDDRFDGVAGVRVERRAWRSGDLDGAFLAVASNDDGVARAAIAREARARGVLVNVVDDIPHCDWAAPAVVRRGDLVLAIGTGGVSPAVARLVRERLQAEFGAEWVDVLRVVGEVRRDTPPRSPISGPAPGGGRRPSTSTRLPAWYGTDALTSSGRFSARGSWTGWQPRDGTRRPRRRRPRRPRADHAPRCPRAGRGGRHRLRPAGRARTPRPGTSRRRTDLRRQGARTRSRVAARDRTAARRPRPPARSVVVRLKGGDPFVFGRGGEEVAACAAAGIPSEVVPGVSAAVAAPAAAGIPVTHRGIARSFAVATGSTAHDDEVDLSKVAGADTLVVLMAAGRLAHTCAELIAAGRGADEPAAIVQWAWTPDQRSVVGTLADLPILAEAASIGPPATLVVGSVAASGASPGLEEIPFAGGVSRGRLPATRRNRP